MKGLRNVLKGALITVLVLLVCYVAFVVVDCRRMENDMFGSKPLIMLSEDVKNVNSRTYVVTYDGLGYSVSYTYSVYQAEVNGKIENIEEHHGATCEWFGKVVWAWIS